MHINSHIFEAINIYYALTIISIYNVFTEKLLILSKIFFYLILEQIIYLAKN
jgi:hypothetical protein